MFKVKQIREAEIFVTVSLNNAILLFYSKTSEEVLLTDRSAMKRDAQSSFFIADNKFPKSQTDDDIHGYSNHLYDELSIINLGTF